MKFFCKLFFAFIVFIVIASITSCFTHSSDVRETKIVVQPTTNIHVHISNDFSEIEKLNIINGILMWERATNRLISWQLSSLEDIMIRSSVEKTYYSTIEQRLVIFVKVSSQDDWVQNWDKEHEKRTLLGYCKRNPTNEIITLLLVEDRLNTNLIQTLIASHEFGHAMGLQHIKDKHSTMSEMPDLNTSCITNEDLFEFCEKYKCNYLLLTPFCNKNN